MHYIVHCLDKPDHLSVRQANRSEHLAFLAANAATILVAGPYLAEGGRMIGTMLIASSPGEDMLKAVLAQDPYVKADLFESVEIRPWKWVIGAPT